MASPNLSGVFALTKDQIDKVVTSTSPGVYVLDSTSFGDFKNCYVGRSDVDLNGRLQSWIGVYKFCKAAYCSSAKAAFEAECELYHDLNPPDNAIHPARPSGSSWKCPRCPIFN